MKIKLGRMLAALPAAFTAALVVGSGLTQAEPRQPVELRFISVSDWHAQLDPLFVFGEGTFGGAAELFDDFTVDGDPAFDDEAFRGAARGATPDGPGTPSCSCFREALRPPAPDLEAGPQSVAAPCLPPPTPSREAREDCERARVQRPRRGLGNGEHQGVQFKINVGCSVTVEGKR